MENFQNLCSLSRDCNECGYTQFLMSITIFAFRMEPCRSYSGLIPGNNYLKSGKMTQDGDKTLNGDKSQDIVTMCQRALRFGRFPALSGSCIVFVFRITKAQNWILHGGGQVEIFTSA